MKTLGIIGGIGPESTIDYYRLLLAAYRERTGDGSALSIIINSIDMHKMLGMIAAANFPQVTEYLIAELQRVERAGADLALIAANTPHIVFDEISRRTSIPLVSIVEAACDAALNLNLNRLGLFGTKFTMQATFYAEAFSRKSIALVMPNQQEQDYIYNKYMNELGNGIFLPETRQKLLAIAQALKIREHIDGLILAGTELPLILRDCNELGIPVLDTTRIHVDAAISRLVHSQQATSDSER